MRYPKVLTVLTAMLASSSGFCVAIDPTWYSNEHGALHRRGAGNEELPMQTGRRLKPIGFAPSDSGFLMYLETTPEYSLPRLGPFVTPEPGVKYLTPGTTVYLLHVCDANLKDKVVVPIGIDGGWNEAYFHGENVVVLETSPRWGGLMNRTIVNLFTKEVFSFRGESDQVQGSEFSLESSFLSVSPNGRKILTTIYARKIGKSLFFLNGTLIHPFFDPTPPLAGSPKYKEALARLHEKGPGSKSAFSFIAGMGDESWSPDSRYVVGFQDDSGAAPNGPTAPPQSHLLILDTEKLLVVKDINRATLRLPFALPAQARNEQMPFYKVRFDAPQGRASILTKDGHPLAQTELPADWKRRIELQ